MLVRSHGAVSTGIGSLDEKEKLSLDLINELARNLAIAPCVAALLPGRRTPLHRARIRGVESRAMKNDLSV